MLSVALDVVQRLVTVRWERKPSSSRLQIPDILIDFLMLGVAGNYEQIEERRLSYQHSSGHEVMAMKKVKGELLRAIDKGDVTAAERALRKGADPNAVDEHNIPPLFYAARRADLEVVSCLIRFGADPLAVEGQFGRNALGFMIHRRQFSVSADQLGAAARLLIAHGLKPDQQPNQSYVSPWWQAVGDCRCISVVKAILDSGLDPNKPLAADTNYTPLMEAAVNRNVEAVRALLDAGANPGATTTRGFSAAQIVEAGDPKDPESNNWSPKDTAEVLRLLRGGQNSDGKGFEE